MRIRRPKPDLLILEHAPWRNLLVLFTFVGALVLFSFSKGSVNGLVVSLLCFGFVWLGARRFEYVRVVIDKSTGRADIRRRTARHGASRACHGLDEIGGVKVEAAGTSRSPLYKLVMVIPPGPHAGRHPLNVFEINERRVPDHARAITSFPKQDP